MDTSEVKIIQTLHYMTPDKLSEFCDVLINMCDTCSQHRLLYEKVLQSKKGLRYNFKNYFNALIDSDEKDNKGNSLLEFAYLKSMFIDKVYLSGMMDIHDYCIRSIKHSITFIKSNRDNL